MSSIVKNQGVMNPAQRYKFTNITEEDFVSYWNSNPITIKAHQTVTLPEYLANKFVDEMVDKIMIGEAKIKQDAYNEKHPENISTNFYRVPSQLGVPGARKVWEDKILVKLPLDSGSTESQLLKLQIQEEIETAMKMEPSTEPPQVPDGAIDTTGLDKNRESLAGAINEEAFSEIKSKKTKK